MVLVGFYTESVIQKKTHLNIGFYEFQLSFFLYASGISGITDIKNRLLLEQQVGGANTT